MRYIFLVVLFITAVGGMAAVQIDQSNWPMDTGNIYQYYGNNNPYNFGYTLPGTPPWNLNSCPHDNSITVEYVAPGSTPAGGSFPSATMALKQHDPSTGYENYTYHRADANGFYMLGTYTTDPGSPLSTIVFNASNPLTVFPFPSVVGTTWSDSTTYTIIILNYPVTINGEMVAEGSVTVPYGASDALLARAVVHISSPTGDAYMTTYTWLVPNLGQMASASISDTSETPETFAIADSVMTLNSAELHSRVEAKSVGQIKSLYR